MSRRYFTGTLLLLLFVSSYSSGQYFSNYDPNKETFVRQVKLIDEFIERFNDDPSTGIRKEYAGNTQYKITRGNLLVSLFNLENTSFTDKDTSLKGFFRAVLNKEHPIYLSFNDPDWYAMAQGVFLYKGQLVELPLILHIKSHGDEWAKWMIAGIGDRVTSNEPVPSVSVSDKGVMPGYISTSAHTTNFVELHYILTGNIVPEYFLEDQLLATPKGQEFLRSVKSGELKFRFVKKISYRFFQVKGWVFTVDEFRRKSLNSGWLISEIHQVTDAQKAAEKLKLLLE